MELYWQHGPMFVRELLEYYAEPRPHFNTLSTTVRKLEREGYLDHILKEERISADELRELLAQVEEYEKSQSV